MTTQALTPEAILPYLVRLMIIFLVNPLHECAHAFAAHKLGDDTAKNAGRLSIDPLTHLDPFGALFLMIFGFGWAKPVPVNPANFKHKNFDMMIVAVAGPLSNLAAAFAVTIAMRLCGGTEQGYFTWIVDHDNPRYYLYYMLYEFIHLNLVLCVFNLLPVPPLDGSRVLNYFLPPKASLWFLKNSRVFYGIMFFLMLTGILGKPIYFATLWLEQGMTWLVQFLPVVI